MVRGGLEMYHRASQRLVLGLVFAPSSYPAVFSQERYPSASLQEKATELAMPFVGSQRAVGLSVGVINRHESSTIHLGKIDIDGPVASDETIYEVGSVSKIFTGILLANTATMELDQLVRAITEMLQSL